MAGLQVNAGAMNNNGNETVTNAEYFANEISSLRANVDGLMTLWRGLSANEFHKSFEAQAENLNRFSALLVELGEAISRGANILNRAEEDNAAAGARLFEEV